MSNPHTATVSLHEEEIGILSYWEDEERYHFELSSRWMSSYPRPVLGQQFNESYSASGCTLPNWFSNLLPQGPFRKVIAKWANLDPADEFELLVKMGADLPGAVSVQPLQTPYSNLPRHRPKPHKLISIAGAQLKLSLRDDERGLAIPVSGERSHYIAKLPAPGFDNTPIVEHATMAWAKAAGLSIPDVSLVTKERFQHTSLLSEVSEEEPIYLISRFDRDEDRGIHIEDMAQVVGQPPGGDERGRTVGQYHGSYEELAVLVCKLCPQDFNTYLRQLVFCLISGNGDAHLKNWSLIYRDKLTPTLSPAYDLLPTVVYGDTSLALSLNKKRQWTDVRLSDLLTLKRWSPNSHTVKGLISDYRDQAMETLGPHLELYPSGLRDRLKVHAEKMSLT